MRHSHARRYIEIKLVISVAVHLLQRRRKNWAAACFYSPSQKHFLPVYLDVLISVPSTPWVEKARKFGPNVIVERSPAGRRLVYAGRIRGSSKITWQLLDATLFALEKETREERERSYQTLPGEECKLKEEKLRGEDESSRGVSSRTMLPWECYSYVLVSVHSLAEE